jgi:hypothetical protein
MSLGEELLQHAEVMLTQRNVPMAVAAFNSAEAQGADPDRCAGERWVAHMLAGNFAAAWRESDAIRRRGAPDPHRFWTGDNLAGQRVILRCLHGFGDAVQFLRYVPRLRSLASQLIIEVAPAMLEIATCFDGVEDVITWGSDAPEVPPGWDIQVETMELPYLFRTELSDLPIARSYLSLPEDLKRRAARVLGVSSLRRVGVVWAAGAWNAERSIPLEILQPLLQTANCEFWSLQGGAAQGEWRMLPDPLCLRDAACFGAGILRLAAIVSQLDLVITVDTLVAHLAGAMDKPAWVVLPYVADWRWMVGRSDSPWYPSLRLFRQPTPGDWQTPVSNVGQSLTRWLGEEAA